MNFHWNYSWNTKHLSLTNTEQYFTCLIAIFNVKSKINFAAFNIELLDALTSMTMKVVQLPFYLTLRWTGFRLLLTSLFLVCQAWIKPVCYIRGLTWVLWSVKAARDNLRTYAYWYQVCTQSFSARRHQCPKSIHRVCACEIQM